MSDNDTDSSVPTITPETKEVSDGIVKTKGKAYFKEYSVFQSLEN